MIARTAIWLLGGLGYLISAYFTLVYYGRIGADLRFVPRACTLNEETCQSLLRRPEARLFGLPNFVVGLFFYAAIIIGALIPAGTIPFLERGLVLASGGACSISVYLTYLLAARLRSACVLCFAAHAINAAIFVLFLLSTGA